MLHKSFFISILCAAAFTFSSCGGSSSNSESGRTAAESNNVDVNALWTMLEGYWKSAQPDPHTVNVFLYFGFDDEQKPIHYVIWYYEGGETQYPINVEKIGETRFLITLETPPNDEDGIFEVHDGYTSTLDIEVGRAAENLITITSSGISKEWKLDSKTAEGRTFDDFNDFP
jgi:hypothetical protein